MITDKDMVSRSEIYDIKDVIPLKHGYLFTASPEVVEKLNYALEFVEKVLMKDLPDISPEQEPGQLFARESNGNRIYKLAGTPNTYIVYSLMHIHPSKLSLTEEQIAMIKKI
jgi:hypothetical protein